MKRKKWSKEEKLKILEEATQGEVIETCRKHEVSTATVLRGLNHMRVRYHLQKFWT